PFSPRLGVLFATAWLRLVTSRRIGIRIAGKSTFRGSGPVKGIRAHGHRPRSAHREVISMLSRGALALASSRTRRGIALSWSVLFILSLLLQYATFALAPAALAVHDDGL